MSKIQVNVEDLKNFADIIGDIENQCDDALRHLNWDFSSFLADLPGVSPKRVKEVEEIYRNVIKKYQAKLDHAQQLVKHTEAAMRQAEKNIGDKAGEFGLEMLGYYDVQRVFGEYDPITGEKVSGADRLLATGMLALSLYPPGKAVGVTGKVAIKGVNAGTKTGTKFGLSFIAKSPKVFQSLKNVVSTGKVLEVFKGVYKQVVEAPLAATKLWLDRTVRQIADFRMPVNGPQLATAMGALPTKTVGDAEYAFVKMVKGEGDNLGNGSKGGIKTSWRDDMLDLDKVAYDKYWNDIAKSMDATPENAKLIGSAKTWDEYIAANPSSDLNKSAENYIKLITENNPWPETYTPSSTSLSVGEKINMAMSPGQDDLKPGGWATLDNVYDVDYVRKKLAVQYDFKPEINRVNIYEVIKELPVKKGEVGPQIDLRLDKYLPGGGSQDALIVPPPLRMKYLKLVDSIPIE